MASCYCTYMARLPGPLDLTTFRTAVDATYERLGHERCRWSEQGRGVSSLSVGGEEQMELTWVWVGAEPIVAAQFADWEPFDSGTLSELFAETSLALGALLGRTSVVGFRTFPEAEETGGELSHVAWFQFFGPRLARRWSPSYLDEGPFERVRWFADGSLALQAKGSPFRFGLEELLVADYLGVKRPSPPVRL